ncbi:caffeoylshikimate esterase-like [Lycium barbarum]|uniref:caffeoylshikimate esterase-like n=1 Tax=Lycium barbarum TaxID=112863 RepID=UPI00293F6F19|nr:caffeoylshikimate esterase-like [Lycium barbarum]
MSHPIFQSNENSPYGEMTREEFYKQHKIIHKQSFMLNKQNMKIFTQSWQPESTNQLRGLVGMIHGYTSESSWLFELNAVALAKAGFFACALDLQGHGYSEGSPGYIPNIQPVIQDCIQYFDSARVDHPELPAFLYGESLGGAIATLICLRQKTVWNGLILSGPMFGVSQKYKPVWPLEKLLPLAAFIAPSWRIVITKPPASKSYKEEWKKKVVLKSPNRLASQKPPAATALELLKVCEYIQRNSHELEVPLLILQGGDDKVCDPEAAKFVYKSAGSNDKTMKIYPGMGHQLIGEPNESVELVFNTIRSWIEVRANLTKI